MQLAVNELWGYALQLFVPLSDEPELVTANVVPDAEALRSEWENQSVAHLLASGLVIPETANPVVISREQHTEHLGELLGDLQQVARLEKFGVDW
jgi:ring-1,2-phenylacetyl-CoA epoxidase subunit PaaC